MKLFRETCQSDCNSYITFVELVAWRDIRTISGIKHLVVPNGINSPSSTIAKIQTRTSYATLLILADNKSLSLALCLFLQSRVYVGIPV